MRSVLPTLVSGTAATMRTSRGVLGPGQARGGEGQQLVGGDRSPHRDERDHLLAQQRVRPADDRCRGNCRVQQQHVLDVARVDVEAAADDEVLAAVHHHQVAVGVDVPDVAGVQPPVHDRSSRRRLVPPVAGHDPGRRDAHLSVDARRQLLAIRALDPQPHSRQRPADAAITTRIRRVHRRRRRHLRAAVAVGHPGRRHAPLELGPHRGRQRRAAGRDVGQRRQVDVLERLGQQHLQHRRHHRSRFDPAGRDQPHELRRVEARHQVQRSGLRHVQPAQPVDEPEDVRHRQRTSTDRVPAASTTC